MGRQIGVAKCSQEVPGAFNEGLILCKLVRAKLASPAKPAKFKRSSVCVMDCLGFPMGIRLYIDAQVL